MDETTTTVTITAEDLAEDVRMAKTFLYDLVEKHGNIMVLMPTDTGRRPIKAEDIAKKLYKDLSLWRAQNK